MKEEMTGYPSIDKPWLNLYSKGIGTSPDKGNIYNRILDKTKDYLTNIALRYYGRRITYSPTTLKKDKNRLFGQKGGYFRIVNNERVEV